jgi:hypothetical protein
MATPSLQVICPVLVRRQCSRPAVGSANSIRASTADG